MLLARGTSERLLLDRREFLGRDVPCGLELAGLLDLIGGRESGVR